MIGNDIVDLKLAKIQSNWQRKGFLTKQFTEYEQETILNSKNPFLQVWLFWSMKEAAYKCYTQETQKRFFAPLKFSCKIQDKCRGSVKVDDKKYYIKYLISNDYVYSLAVENTHSKMVSEYIITDNYNTLNQKLNQQLVLHFDKNVQIIKNEIGIPYVYQNNEVLPISVTTTHHGNYGAYAISYL